MTAAAHTAFPERLLVIHARLAALLLEHRPDCVAIENIFHAKNVRSALKLGHARGVALLAASQAGVPVAEYTPAEIKRAVVGFGRAEKRQVGSMVKMLLGLDDVPSPHDVADAIAVAICHAHRSSGTVADALRQHTPMTSVRSWRQYRPVRNVEPLRPGEHRERLRLARGDEWSAAQRRPSARRAEVGPRGH